MTTEQNIKVIREILRDFGIRHGEDLVCAITWVMEDVLVALSPSGRIVLFERHDREDLSECAPFEIDGIREKLVDKYKR